jgi:hypothetical protein
VAPLGGSDRDPGAPTINAMKHRWHPPVRRAGDLGAPIINAENIDGGPYEALMEMRERPSSALRNVDGGLPERR